MGHLRICVSEFLSFQAKKDERREYKKALKEYRKQYREKVLQSSDAKQARCLETDRSP